MVCGSEALDTDSFFLQWGRRTAFMKALKRMLETLEVTYSLPVQPVYMEGGNGQSHPYARWSALFAWR